MKYWDIYEGRTFITTLQAASAKAAIARARKELGKGRYRARPVGSEPDWKRKNPKRKSKTRKATKRISAALTRFLEKQGKREFANNPAMRTATAIKIKRLKGGVIKFIPVK